MAGLSRLNILIEQSCRRRFIGAIPDICTATPVEFRLRGADQGWSIVMKLLQKYVYEMSL